MSQRIVMAVGLFIASLLSFASLHGGVALGSAAYRFLFSAPIAMVSALVFWKIWRAGIQAEPEK